MAGRRVRRLMAVYREHEDLIAIGAYRAGVDKEIDAAINWHGAIESFLQQDLMEPTDLEETVSQLEALGEPDEGA